MQYNKRRWLITRIKLITLGVACVFSGSVRYYYYGYQDNELVAFVTMSFEWLGWIIILIVFYMTYVSDKKIVFKKNKTRWLKQKSIYIGLISAFVLIVFGHMVLMEQLENARVERILNTEPTVRTTAIIKENEMHNSRDGAKKYARFEYTVGGMVISKSVFNGDDRFVRGKTYTLVYSIEYPEMFEIYSDKQ